MPNTKRLPEQLTRRKYAFSDGSSWLVQNEYWQVGCPDSECDALQFGRLTYILRYYSDGRQASEHHLNFLPTLLAAQELLVAYDQRDGDSEDRVEERLVDGAWALLHAGVLVARAVGS